MKPLTRASRCYVCPTWMLGFSEGFVGQPLASEICPANLRQKEWHVSGNQFVQLRIGQPIGDWDLSNAFNVYCCHKSRGVGVNFYRRQNPIRVGWNPERHR
jgi:hypothetical protein